MRARRAVFLLAALTVLFPLGGVGHAQDAEADDFGSVDRGWVLRFSGHGNVVAGTAELGYVALGGRDIFSELGAAYSADGLTWESFDFDAPIGDPWAMVIRSTPVPRGS